MPVSGDTASNGSSDTCPSSDKQLVFARVLEQEMREMGLQNVRLDENGYLYGTVPGNIEGYTGPVLGFIAHMDVVNDVPSWDIKPRIVENYDGGDIVLGDSGFVLSVADFPHLKEMKGRTLINIDSEEEGIFTVSCAGGVRTQISMPVQRRAVYGPCVRLTVEGLRGGHSGVEIHKKLANANKVMGEFMSRIQKLMPLCLTNLSGGSKDNAIPRSCQATMVAMGINLQRINTIAEELQAEIREQYDEPEVTIQAFDVDALGGNGLSTESTAKIIGLLCAAPNGVQKMSDDIPGLVQTSLNLGIAKLGERFTATFSVRSSVNTEKLELLEQLKKLCAFYEGVYTEKGDYPAWEYKKDSELRDTMVKVYTEMYGKAPEVLAIHAGLECGLLGEKIPGLDCVSVGPQMHDIHTSRERLEIASTRRTWNFLLEVLKAL